MNLDRLKTLLRTDEGLRLKRYRCPAGHWTIGYGWNIDANPLPGDIAAYEHARGQITQEMADRLEDISARAAVAQAAALYPDLESYSEARQLALVDFVFNVGVSTAARFRDTNAAIRAGDWEEAARGFENSLWYRQVGDRARRLVAMIREG